MRRNIIYLWVVVDRKKKNNYQIKEVKI
jgi:hypothetical protein